MHVKYYTYYLQKEIVIPIVLSFFALKGRYGTHNLSHYIICVKGPFRYEYHAVYFSFELC